MRFGCHLPVYGPAATRDTLVGFARRAEALGYDSLWASDHVVLPWRIASRYPYSATGDFPLPPATDFLEPLTALALVAGVTERAALGTTVLVLPHRHPLLAAKMLATLDHLAPGRVILGARAEGRDRAPARRVYQNGPRSEDADAQRAARAARQEAERRAAGRGQSAARPRRGPRDRGARRARSRVDERGHRAVRRRSPRETLDLDAQQPLRQQPERVRHDDRDAGDDDVQHDAAPHVHAGDEGDDRGDGDDHRAARQHRRQDGARAEEIGRA